MKTRKLLLLSSFLFLGACAELELVSPNARIEPPETRGARGWMMGGEITPAHVYQATENGGARPPDLTKPKIRGHADFVPHFGYSFLPFLDTALEINTLGQGVGVLVKWQFTGSGSTTPEEGSFASAIYLRSGYTHGSKSGDQKDIFGAGGYHWKGNVSGTYTHLGISAGYRTKKWMMVYAGAAAGRTRAESKIDQDSNDSGTDPGGSYKSKDSGLARSAGAGVQFGWTKFHTFVSGNYNYIDYDNVTHVEDAFVHAGFVFTP